MLGFCCGCFLGEGGYRTSVAAGPQTGFGAIAPGDVEAVALLTGVVRRGGFSIGEAVAFGSWHPWGWFWLSGGLVAGTLWGCVLLPPSGLFYLVVHSWGCVGSPESRPYPPYVIFQLSFKALQVLNIVK